MTYLKFHSNPPGANDLTFRRRPRILLSERWLADLTMLVLKFEQITMPEPSENWLGLVNSCVYYTHQTRKINSVLPY